jgi:phosphoglycerate dehydrogenase-like enzyme
LKLVIHHDFSFSKYLPGVTALPEFATAAKLRAEIAKRDPSLDAIAASDRDAMIAALHDADGCISYSISRDLLESAPKLRWIQAGSAGIDHFFKSSDITLADLSRRGITLTKAAGVTRHVIGEHVFAMILAVTRNIPRAVEQKQRRVWEIYMGAELNGATLGIIGLGGIGDRVAELGKAFGMRVIGTKRDVTGYAGAADEVLAQERAQDVAAMADYLVLACPLTAQTRNMVTAGFLAAMKPHAVLVNIARGEIICEPDLVHALKTGVIAAAALDTFGRPGRQIMSDLEALDPDSELWTLPNVLIMPNNASASPRIYEHLADIVVANAARLRAGEPLRGLVKPEDVIA